MKTSKKISLVVAVISAVFLDVGIQLIGMGVRSLVPIEFLYITPYYCEFAASRQPCFCCSALIWSILSIISCRLCSVEVCFNSSSSTFNSPASRSQSVIELFLPCVAINATRGEPFRVSTWPFARWMPHWHDRRWHSRFRLARRTPQHNGCRLAHMPRKQSRTQA